MITKRRHGGSIAGSGLVDLKPDRLCRIVDKSIVILLTEDRGPLFPSKSVILQNQTGIGVFILSSRRHTLSSGYFFQVAITPCILEPLEAEDWALLLGARFAAALNLQVLNFLTDNEIH